MKTAMISQLEPSLGDLLPLKFVGRENESRTICESDAPLLVIDAPAGYGKTYVLEEVERRLRDKWKCIFIKLEQCQGKCAIRNEIIRQLEIHNISTNNDQESDILLIRALGLEGKIILMFDSLERAADEDREWLLGDFIPNCVKSILVSGFRVIVAGRYASVNFPSLLRHYERISLHPFSQGVVEEILIDVLRTCTPSSDVGKKHIKTWSMHILRLSGGHPRSVQKLVTSLARKKYRIITSPQQEKALFLEHVTNELDSIIYGLDGQTKQALKVLSVFRIFNFNVVQVLQSTSLPKDFEFPRDIINSQAVVSSLSRYGLVTKERLSPFFCLDKTVRNLVLAQIRILFPEVYKELHRVAQRVYDTWIEQLIQHEPYGPFDPQEILVIFIRESIYHFCESFFRDDNKLTQKQMADCLSKHSKYLVQGLGVDNYDPQYRAKLENMIAADEEIRETLEEQTPDFQTLWQKSFETGWTGQSEGEKEVEPMDRRLQEEETADKNQLFDTVEIIPLATKDISKGVANNAIATSAKVEEGEFVPKIGRELRVFLCYHAMDQYTVERFYQKLAAVDWIDPWMDEKRLLGGQDRVIEIEKAVRNADVVIFFSSENSIDKEGYVQTQLKYILDVSKEKPDGKIFILPVQLDSRQIPHQLAKWVCIDYSQKDNRRSAFKKVLQSLNKCRENLSSHDLPSTNQLPVLQAGATESQLHKADINREDMSQEQLKFLLECQERLRGVDARKLNQIIEKVRNDVPENKLVSFITTLTIWWMNN